VRRGYSEIRLYTNVLMIENRRLYAAIGDEQTGRGIGSGFERVFMCKRLSGPSTDTVLPIQKQLEAYNAREPRSRRKSRFFSTNGRNGHEERFAPTRLSVGYRIGQRTFAAPSSSDSLANICRSNG
jgi:hypothetical protein